MSSKDHMHTWAHTASGFVCTGCTAFVTQPQYATGKVAGVPNINFNIKNAWNTSGEGSGHGG
jgi:hypothetical protein